MATHVERYKMTFAELKVGEKFTYGTNGITHTKVSEESTFSGWGLYRPTFSVGRAGFDYAVPNETKVVKA